MIFYGQWCHGVRDISDIKDISDTAFNQARFLSLIQISLNLVISSQSKIFLCPNCNKTAII